MKFILVADKNQVLKDFFPFWQLALFIGVSSLLLLALVPRSLLEKTLNAESTPARLTYLQAYGSKSPENIPLQITVIEQEIQLGLISSARKHIQALKTKHPNLDTPSGIKWLDYLILRYYAYNLKPNTSKRIYYLTELSMHATQIVGPPFDNRQLKIVAMDHVFLGEAPLALKIYNYFYEQKILTTVRDFEDAALIAIESNNQAEAAKFYEQAYLKSTKLKDKKIYALAVIKAFWANNMPDKSISFAKTLPKDVTEEPEMLALLWRVAMAASRPEVAEEYAIRALLLGPSLKSTNTPGRTNSPIRLEK